MGNRLNLGTMKSIESGNWMNPDGVRCGYKHSTSLVAYWFDCVRILCE